MREYPDVSILLDWNWCHWIENIVSILHTVDTEAHVFPFSHHQFRTEFLKACQSLKLQNVTPYQARHSGPSSDRAMDVGPRDECKSRGQWRTEQSVERYEKSDCLAADYLALPRRTRELLENLCIVC